MCKFFANRTPSHLARGNPFGNAGGNHFGELKGRRQIVHLYSVPPSPKGLPPAPKRLAEAPKGNKEDDALTLVSETTANKSLREKDHTL